jgi:hypothetical protein
MPDDSKAIPLAPNRSAAKGKITSSATASIQKDAKAIRRLTIPAIIRTDNALPGGRLRALIPDWVYGAVSPTSRRTSPRPSWRTRLWFPRH